MARFLQAIIDGGGTVPPAMGVAGELVRRGHGVTVLADPTVAPSAGAAGCDFVPWRAAPHFASVEEQTAFLAAFESGNPVRAYRIARDRLMGGGATAGFASDLLAVAGHVRPAAVLAEAAVPGILIGAFASALPTASLMPNIYLRPTAGLPLMGTGWQPARGAAGRARDALAPRATRLLTDRFVRGLNTTLRAHGLRPIGDLFELLDRCTEVLVLTSPSLDFSPPHLPPNVRYVGPQLDDPDWATQGEPGSWRPDGDGPLVLVAGSSVFQHQTDLLRRATAALGRLPVRGLVTTGRAVDPRDVPAPDNVRVLRAAPHRAVLEEAAVAVTHAGHGSLLKALAAGVPLVCMPMGRDQKDNTVRALRLGAGVRVSPKASPETIAAAVGRVLAEPAYALAARRFADTLAAEARSRPSAADRAEALLGSDHPPPAASGGQLGG
jgi:UDP:flavonoid glycosyltransferase YjiC (YdhE family)